MKKQAPPPQCRLCESFHVQFLQCSQREKSGIRIKNGGFPEKLKGLSVPGSIVFLTLEEFIKVSEDSCSCNFFLFVCYTLVKKNENGTGGMAQS